jgi:TonB family protein
MVLEALTAIALGLQTMPSQPSTPDCRKAAQTPELSELCLGDEALRRGESAAKASPQRADLLESAATHYKRAATLAREPQAKARALDALATALDAQHLDEPANEEATLRDLIATIPDELAPMFRLAALQEHQQELDAAEETLLSARRGHPDSIEPYKRLMQFYSRRIVALQPVTVKEAFADSAKTGAPDDNGVYRVGGGIQAPTRLDRPIYPPEAKAAGVTGVVIVEVVIDPRGAVTDAKVLRSIPLLDDEALRAVRTWTFQPTIVGGEAVPVRMNVAVSFTDR